MNKEIFIQELNKLNIKITEEQLNKLELFYDLLIKWNDLINLTRITKKEDVYLQHFYDSLTLTKVVNLNNINTLCDVGTGAGFPGIVLKILYPNLKITLIDSLQKRVNYLNEIIKEIKLDNIKAIHIRGEDYHEKFDLVTSRAVANIEKLVNYTMHLVDKKGLFIAMKGEISKDLTEEVKEKIEKKYKIIEINEFLLPIEDSKRSLLVMKNK